VNYQSPGVYIEEVPSGPQPITAAPTSVVAVIGTTERGPIETPVRITGWADYVRTFGGRVPGRFTAESIFGYFENGGPAAYVVRVDPSLAAQWRVDDAAGNQSFRIDAKSPGDWANALTVTVAPDTTGGSGQLYFARVQQDTAFPSATATAVPVAPSVGVRASDAVLALRTDGSTAEAAVDAVADGRITITKPSAGDFDLAEGDVIVGLANAGDVTIRLAAGAGIRAGDLVVAELPDRTRVTGTVQAAVSEGAALVITLAAGLAADVPGGQFAARTARFRGTIGVTDETVALGEVTWQEEDALRPVVADITSANFRAYAANGLEAVWDAGVGAGAFRFPTVPPPGRIEAEAVLSVHRYTETINLTDPTVEQLAARFSYVPEGTELRITSAAGTATLTRTADSFTTGDSLTGTFTSAEFRLPADASDGVLVRCARPPAVGDYVDFGAPLLEITGVTSPGGNIYVLAFEDTDDLSGTAGDKFPLMAFQQTRFFPLRFSIRVEEEGGATELFSGLALDPAHPSYYFRDEIVNEVSELIRVSERLPAAIDATTLPAVAVQTQAGVDNDAGPANYRDGLEALEAEPEPAMVICPDTVTFADDLTAAEVIGAVVTHCETFRRLAIVDTPRGGTDQDLRNWRLQTVASTYASVYAPHVQMTSLDPNATERFVFVPPSGFVAGVMARVDRERGVHKAPGNERVRGIVGLSENYTQRRQDALNPNGVNVIRSFPGRGLRIWGARNATDDSSWRFTHVRRVFNMVENSTERSTQWVVFEPNTPSTWLRLKVSVENFLDQLWRAGALDGASADEAYRVRVGLGETMSETDVLQGLVIVEVAIRVAGTSEVIVFRFSHKRLSD
jgi:phage tail sheath protein FI